MAVSGDVLWGWQSQLPDGAWSLIAAATGVAGAPFDTHVLIHREREVAVRWQTYAGVHRAQLHQPIRLVRFELAEVEAEMHA